MSIFNRQKKDRDDGYYQGPGWAKLSSIVCERCGCDLHLIREDQIVVMDGKKYCDVCAAYLNRPKADPEKERPESARRPVVRRATAAPVKAAVPANAVCVKCGAPVANEAGVHSVKDRYYCKACYEKIKEKRDLIRMADKREKVARFWGKTPEGVSYELRHEPERDFFCVEISDETGRYLSDMGWHPGLSEYAVFALTEEEFALRAVQNDEAQMNLLVRRLLEGLPKDRFVTAGSTDKLTGARRENIPLELKSETMDGGAFRRYRAQRAIAYLKSLDVVYAVFSRATGDPIPSVDGFGFAWLFSKREYVQTVLAANPGAGLYYRMFDQAALAAFVKTWYRLGVFRFKLNPGFLDRSAEVDRDDFLPVKGLHKWNISGSSLNQLIIRFRQNRAIQSDPNARAAAATMWSSICHELYQTVLLVPVAFDNGQDSGADPVIHVTGVGAAMLSRSAGYGAGREQVGGPEGVSLCTLNGSLIYGSEKRRFAREGEVAPGRAMFVRTLEGPDGAFLCGFTDLEALYRVFGENVSVAAQPYEELASHMADLLSGGGVPRGIVINPGFNELILSRENIEYAAKEKDASIKVYTANA